MQERKFGRKVRKDRNARKKAGRWGKIDIKESRKMREDRNEKEGGKYERNERNKVGRKEGR